MILTSNGAGVRIKGSAAQIASKYETLAKEAHMAGDSVLAESHRQHAEHYNRLAAGNR